MRRIDPHHLATLVMQELTQADPHFSEPDNSFLTLQAARRPSYTFLSFSVT